MTIQLTTGKYILEGKTPVLEPDLMKWARWFEKNLPCHVDLTELPLDISVSTIFLSIDRAFIGQKPILFETMIFGGEHDLYQERYHTWKEAEAGHKKAVEMAFELAAFEN